ncbi:hypothetical protein SSX86_007043 [Deinandra increscens subsp. villosa]|uniref:DUF295 domain-containing protein n=1 Tax=Deinandra increscens subsp. villosa TaxID=3103831 RepID=A0AAP0H9A1_9ASTR
MTTWSDLPPEILTVIAGNLDFHEDYVTFLSVCTSWKSSATTTKNTTIGRHLPSRFPMLMLAEQSNTKQNETEKRRRFFLLSNGGSIRTLPLLAAHRQRCVSSHGWLLSTGEREFYTKLVNPISNIEIDLPELYMFEELYFDQDEWMYYGFCMRKCLLTSPNPSLPEFRVIIVWGTTIGFCRPGDVAWGRVDGWEGNIFDIAYHQMRKRLYVVATMGTIYECDVANDVLSPLTLSRVTTFPGKEFGCLSVPWGYLVEWGCDRLLMIVRERESFTKNDDGYGRYGSYRTSGFRCFVFGLDDGKWSETVSLGENAVFLGFNSSFVICGGECVKPNCIYFTDDLYEPYRGLPEGGGGDVGIYDMFDGRIETIFGSEELGFRGAPPLWLQTCSVQEFKGVK